MRQRLLVPLLSAALIVVLVPAQSTAWEVAAPDWAEMTGMPATFHWGNWVPCRPEYREDDCIADATWIKSDGSRVVGKWVAKPTFSYATWQEKWVKDAQGKDLQWSEPMPFDMGSYQFEGMTTPCNDDRLVPVVHAAMGSMQANWAFTCAAFARSKFEERVSITLKSSHLPGKVGSLSSNGRNPQVEFKSDSQAITIEANFAYIPWNVGQSREFLDVCSQNQERAGDGGWTLYTSVKWIKVRNDPFLAEHPGDMITGTNGWNCGGALGWDESESALVMQVGAPHFDIDGKEVEGWFEGQVRGRYIKARYGVEPALAAGRARLEVTYANGDVKVATMTAAYDKVTDWITFRAYGFTYSTPRLILRIERPEVAPSPTPSPTPTLTKPVVTKSVTITCIKGKTVKKVKGTKCPSGFKKK